jgi:uncharacterized protein (DUF4415 family)
MLVAKDVRKGVVGKFLSGPDRPDETDTKAIVQEPAPAIAEVLTPQIEATEPARQKVKTKIGRPLGKSTVAREKVSIYINASLIEEFRKRTWSEQCQLGELIERAMQDYAQRWK